MTKVLLIEDDAETAGEIAADSPTAASMCDWAADGLDGLDKARARGRTP